MYLLTIITESSLAHMLFNNLDNAVERATEIADAYHLTFDEMIMECEDDETLISINYVEVQD